MSNIDLGCRGRIVIVRPAFRTFLVAFQAGWIRMVLRIISDIRIEVDLVLVPDRIGLQEPTERG
jgi:hypothetical protein